MADFNKAIKKLLVTEGGYVNDPDDSGGETFAGVARRYNPNWGGWKLIDTYKKDKELFKNKKAFSEKLWNDKELVTLIHKVYKDKYWDVFDLDLIPSFKIAFAMFDTCVNMGQSAAVKCAERALGINNPKGIFTKDLFNQLAKYK